MSKIGQIVKETIDFSNRVVPSLAFTKACEAFSETAKKHFGKENISEKEYLEFFKENWWLINFIGLPGVFPVDEEITKTAREKIYKIGSAIKMDEIIFYILTKNLTTRGLPMGMEFNTFTKFELVETKILIPQQLIFGILGTAVFNPLNKDEEIPENYWLDFRGYKMFVSELWGRMDLVERAMKYA